MKLSNCGLATKIKTESTEKLKCGTPGFIAPEVLNDEGYGLPADVYSCGIVLYALYILEYILIRLTGILPFKTLQKNKEGKLDFTSKEKWSDISEDALDLVKKMTVRNPYQRISLKKCLKHKWFSNTIAQQKTLKAVLERLNKQELNIEE